MRIKSASINFAKEKKIKINIGQIDNKFTIEVPN